MGIKQIVESKGYKNFMSKLYGLGASVVILGALFKIMHYPGAEIMLLAGMGTEAVIFAMSSFEPLHVEADWSLVYPELWGLYHPDEAEELGWEPKKSGPESKKGSVTEELDKMLEEAKIGPELIQSLASGMQNLSENANKMTGVADAAVATDGFLENLTKAGNSVSGLSEVYNKTTETLNKTVGVNEEYVESVKSATQNANGTSEAFHSVAQALNNDINATEEYVTSIKSATTAAHSLAEKYNSSAESLTKSAEAIDFSKVDGQSYGDQIQRITKNLGALNAVYELQLQGSQAQLDKAEQMGEGISTFINNMNDTMTALNQYRDQANAMAQNLAALNNVYGNMLSAMNVNVSK
ncbi:MAG: gliding motility protein GldL [Bacteroidales bacterium]|nr:gliding motility protein GldL [Bacteroidales bacterium]